MHLLSLPPLQPPHSKQLGAATMLLSILKERGGKGDAEEAKVLAGDYGL